MINREQGESTESDQPHHLRALPFLPVCFSFFHRKAHGMEPISSRPDVLPEAVHMRRMAIERSMIAEAYADIAAGRGVGEKEVDAWIDRLGTENELPVPRSIR